MSDFNFYDTRIKLTGNVIEIRKYTNDQLRIKNESSSTEKRFTIELFGGVNIIYDTQSKYSFHSVKELYEYLKDTNDITPNNIKELLALKYKILSPIQKQLFNKIKTLHRCKEKMIDIINSNLPLEDMRKFKVLTLTYRDEQTDINESNEDMKKFIKRFNYKFMKNENLKYIAIKEYQKNGNIHFHIVLFNAPYISNLKEIDNCWGLGMTNYQIIKDVGNIGLYVAKIMDYVFKEPQEMIKKIESHDLTDDEIINIMESNEIIFQENHKFYLCSRGLKRAIIKYTSSQKLNEEYQTEFDKLANEIKIMTQDVKLIENIIADEKTLGEKIRVFKVQNFTSTYGLEIKEYNGLDTFKTRFGDVTEDDILKYNFGKVKITRYCFDIKDERLKLIEKLLKKGA